MKTLFSIWKKTVCKSYACLGIALAALMMFSFSFSGCFGNAREIEGHWVDVNGKTTLDIEGNKLTVRFGEWSETYRFRQENIEGVGYIVNTKDRDFGGMSEIRIGEDGSLTAQEMVLDDKGHYYRFVREENLAQEYEIRDLSQDLPKEINSSEIKKFSLGFTNYCGSYGLDKKWPSGRYSWEIEQREGSYHMDFCIMGPSYIALDFSDDVSEEYVAGLASLLEEQEISRLNGYYHKNNVDYPGYSLYVVYGSKEKLTIRAEGEAAKACVFNLPLILDYAAKQDLFREEPR